MASKARKAFDKNAEDIDRLMEIHRDLGGDGPGRRYRLEVLNKSAIVLITAFWESYCEDIAAEALNHIVKHSKSVDSLPKNIRKIVAKELKQDANELAVWSLAGKGWRKLLKDRLEKLQEQRNRKLNTPKAGNIDQLFLDAVGIKEMSTSWTWPKMTVVHARKKLDDYVTLRGGIAHRGAASQSCKKKEVDDYFAFVKRLVGKTGGRVNSHVKNVTGKGLW